MELSVNATRKQANSLAYKAGRWKEMSTLQMEEFMSDVQAFCYLITKVLKDET